MDIQPHRGGYRNGVILFGGWLAQQGLRWVYNQAVQQGNRAVINNLRAQYDDYVARVEFNRRAADYEERNKRPRVDPQPSPEPPREDTDMTDNSGAAGNSGQWQWQYDRYGSKRRPTMKFLMDKALRSYVYRWQSLSNFAITPAFLPLAQVWDNATKKTSLPMYAFDLSTMAMGYYVDETAPQNAKFKPMYRMISDRSTVTASSANYDWLTISGSKNDPTGTLTSARYSVEDCDRPGGTEYPAVTKYFHEWSDIRLVMNGAKTRPSRVHVKLVQFNDADYSPRRLYDNLTPDPATEGQYDDPVTDAEVRREIDSFWDNFWCHRETNPIRALKNDNPRKLYRVLYHRTFEFAATSTVDNDTNADQKVFKLFHNAGKHFNTDTGIDEALQENVLWGADASYGYKARTSFNLSANKYSPFPKSDKTTWLLVYADTFVKNSGAVNQDTCPSFDIIVRQKVVVPPVN